MFRGEQLPKSDATFPRLCLKFVSIDLIAAAYSAQSRHRPQLVLLIELPGKQAKPAAQAGSAGVFVV